MLRFNKLPIVEPNGTELVLLTHFVETLLRLSSKSHSLKFVKAIFWIIIAKIDENQRIRLPYNGEEYSNDGCCYYIACEYDTYVDYNTMVRKCRTNIQCFSNTSIYLLMYEN